jgi:hypothetical protein
MAHDLAPTSRSGASHWALVVAGLASGLAVTAPACAQDRYVNLTVSTQYDDNLRRLPDDEKSFERNNGQEITTRIGADAGITANLGLIDFQVDGGVARRFFAYNDELNSEEYQLAAGADYQALSGSASVNALISRQNLSFNDPVFRGTSVRDLRMFSVDADRRLIGDIRLAGSAAYQSSSSPDPILSRADNRTYSYSIGLSYVSPLENRLEIGYNESTSEGDEVRTIIVGETPLQYTADAKNRGIYGEIAYSPTVLLSLNARVGYTWHDDQSVLDADFNGVTQAISLTWVPLENLTVVGMTSRSFSSNNELFSNGVQSSSYSLTAQGVAGPRITVNASARYAQRDFRYDLQADDPVIVPRSDRFWIFEAGTQYQTGIGVDVGVQLRHISIDDNGFRGSASDNSITLTLAKRFQL